MTRKFCILVSTLFFTMLIGSASFGSIADGNATPCQGGIFPGGEDPAFSFTFTAGTLSGSGELQATANGDGTYTVISGSGIVNGTPVYLLHNIISNPSPPNVQTSPLGSFYFDNQIKPGQNPLLDTYGLLFATDTGLEVNIWGDGLGAYSYYESSVKQVYSTAIDRSATFTLIQVVPEPATIAVWSLLGASGMGGLALVRRRNRR